MGGMRPVAEVQFAGFLYPALDQVMSHLGRYRHRTRGRVSLPVVVRAAYGGGVHTPEQHADSPEGILAAVPGVKVVVPSTPERAKGLLLSAIEDPDPVFFLEAIKLYRSQREDVPEGHYTHPLGRARIARRGDAATLVCYGGMVEVCLKAAAVAAREGVEPELVPVVVPKGGGSFHHGWTWHGSGYNRSECPRRSLVLHAMRSDTRYVPEHLGQGVGRIYSRYKHLADNEIDENYFPVLWREDGYRTPGLDAYLVRAA